MIAIKKIKRRAGFRVVIEHDEGSRARTSIMFEMDERTLAKLIDQGIAALVRAQHARKGGGKRG